MTLVESPQERHAYRASALVTLLLVFAFLAWVYDDGDESGLLGMAGHAGVSFAVGKFIVFAGLTPGAPSPWQLAGLVFLLDLAFAFVMGSGMGVLERAPLVGRRLTSARARAVAVLAQYPGLARRAFFGVALFVFLPLAGTGAITGTLLARIFGLARIDGIAAIALGSATTAGIFALLAELVGAQAETILRNPIWAAISTAVLLFAGWRAYVRFLERLKN